MSYHMFATILAEATTRFANVCACICPPTRCLAMSLSDSFSALCTKEKVPAVFKEWLIDNEILDEVSFALLTSKEEKVDEKILDPAKAEGKEVKKLGEQLAVKKTWLACRKMVNTGASNGSAGAPSVTEQDCIPDHSAIDIKDCWKEYHNFVVPDAWVLEKTTLKKLWVGANSVPAKVDTLLMEQLRLASSLGHPVGTNVNFQAGKQAEATEFIADVINNRMEVIMRTRAWFYSMSYVSIRVKSFFNLQTAIFGADTVMELCLKRPNGVSVPVPVLCTAWAATIHHFSEQVRVQQKSLIDIVMNTGSWTHLWSWVAPVTQSSGGGSAAQDSLPKDVQIEMARLREQARQLQSANDRQRNELRAWGLTPVYDKNGGKGGKGKGKPKGGTKDNRYRSRSRGRSGGGRCEQGDRGRDRR